MSQVKLSQGRRPTASSSVVRQHHFVSFRALSCTTFGDSLNPAGGVNKKPARCDCFFVASLVSLEPVCALAFSRARTHCRKGRYARAAVWWTRLHLALLPEGEQPGPLVATEQRRGPHWPRHNGPFAR